MGYRAPALLGSTPALVRLQPLDSIELGEIAVVGAEGQVPGFPSDLQHEAVRETYRRPLSKMFDRGRYSIGVLERKMLVVEQHLDRRRNRACG
jgi:hypothetical protein